MKRVVPLLIALASSIGAQVRFDVPKLGYVYDSEAKSIRQIGGVPGAAAFDAVRIDAGGSVERAWISSQGYAVVQGKQDSGSRLVDWTRGASAQLADIETAAVSNSGRYFATAQAGAVEVWDGVSATRSARFEGAPAGVQNLAVSDDGGAVLLATADSVYLWQDKGAAQPAWAGDSIKGVSFLSDTRDYAAFDGGTGKLLLSRGGSANESDVPAGAAFATFGSKLAFGGAKSIVILDLDGGNATQTIETGAAVERFSRVSGSGDVLQVRFQNDGRTALLEPSSNGAAQVEFLVNNGGAL